MINSELPFCDFEIEIETNLVYARFDKLPVSTVRCLIAPKLHVETWFDMATEEQREAFAYLQLRK